MIKLETDRLLLVPWEDTKEDAEALYKYASNPNVGPHAGWKPHEDVKESRKIIKTVFLKSDENFKIIIRETGEVIGSISVFEDTAREKVNSKEIGYALGEDYWGQGYMTEACRAVIDYAFAKYDLAIIAIRTSRVNKRSQRVIEKCGFVYEGTLRKAYRIYDGTDRDSCFYSITREEWEGRKI